MIFFFSESWDLIVYIARNHLANAPIFWRVSSFKGTLTNKKFAFRRQIRKMARFSSLWVEMQFWHRNRKEHPIFDLEPPWFKFMTLKTTSRDPTNKKNILALTCQKVKCNSHVYIFTAFGSDHIPIGDQCVSHFIHKTQGIFKSRGNYTKLHWWCDILC